MPARPLYGVSVRLLTYVKHPNRIMYVWQPSQAYHFSYVQGMPSIFDSSTMSLLWIILWWSHLSTCCNWPNRKVHNSVVRSTSSQTAQVAGNSINTLYINKVNKTCTPGTTQTLWHVYKYCTESHAHFFHALKWIGGLYPCISYPDPRHVSLQVEDSGHANKGNGVLYQQRKCFTIIHQ